MKHLKNSLIDKKTLLFLFGTISTFCGLTFFYFSTIVKPGNIMYSISSANGKNLLSYGITILICLILFFLFTLIFRKYISNNISTRLLPRYLSFSIITLFLFISSILFLNILFFYEDPLIQYAKNFPTWFSFPICIIAVIFSYFIILRKKINVSSNNILLYSLYLLLALLNAIRYANINVFGTLYSLYHCNAVTSSIHNVYYNTPFNILTSGIYGHYAIFLKIPLMVFGNSPLVIGIIIGVIGFISCMLSFATVHVLLKSDYIKALSAISLVFLTNIVSETYWQTMPIRWIFPSIILFLASIYVKKETIISLKHILFGCFLCSLSILWETETGLFCAITWAIFCSLRVIQINGLSFKRLIYLIFNHTISYSIILF